MSFIGNSAPVARIDRAAVVEIKTHNPLTPDEADALARMLARSMGRVNLLFSFYGNDIPPAVRESLKAKLAGATFAGRTP